MYKNLRQALLDLEKAGMLKRVHEEVDPHLQMAEIARQAFDRNGPALLFEKVKGCRFQAVCNIFGTRERMDFLFRDTLRSTRRQKRASARSRSTRAASGTSRNARWPTSRKS